jgi:cytochrome P450
MESVTHNHTAAAALPPGPRLGLRDGLEYLRAPAAFYRRVAAAYGDPFTLRTPFGTAVMTGHPEGVRTIFGLERAAAHTWNPDMIAAFVGERSLFITEGAEHARDRALVMPAFRGARLAAYERAFAEAADAECAAVRGTVSVDELAREISLRTIVRTILGVSDRARTGDVVAVIRELVERISPLLVLVPQLRRPLAGVGPWSAYLRALAAFERLLAGEIARKRAEDGGDDVLGALVAAGLDDRAIRDIVLTLLLAGHETSAISLVWAVYWLSSLRDVRRRLIDELATADDVATAPYLDAFCNETLRLHPVVPENTRELAAPLRLRGYLLPAGIAVGVSAPLAHMRAEVFPEPERFDPGRFLGRRYAAAEFFPFGGGFRHCVGAAFAVRQLKVVVARLLAHGIEALPGPRLGTRRRNLTIGPDREVYAVLRR